MKKAILVTLVLLLCLPALGLRRRRPPQKRLCELMSGTLHEASAHWHCHAPVDGLTCSPQCQRHIERRQIDPQYWQGPDPATAPTEYDPHPLAEIDPGWLVTCNSICGGENEVLLISGPNLDFRAWYTPSTDELLCHTESMCLCRDPLLLWRIWTSDECNRDLFEGMECPADHQCQAEGK